MKDTSDELVQQLEQLIPKSIDDVIRANREKAMLYLSTEAELAALHGPIPIGAIKGKIAYWCFITFLVTENNQASVILTGFNEAKQSSWMTSVVTAINGSTVLTRSGSIYFLVGESSAELDLPYICATLNRWGVGQHLGVPSFFF